MVFQRSGFSWIIIGSGILNWVLEAEYNIHLTTSTLRHMNWIQFPNTYNHQNFATRDADNLIVGSIFDSSLCDRPFRKVKMPLPALFPFQFHRHELPTDHAQHTPF